MARAEKVTMCQRCGNGAGNRTYRLCLSCMTSCRQHEINKYKVKATAARAEESGESESKLAKRLDYMGLWCER